MNKPSPRVRDYMTAFPFSIGDEQTLATAGRVMREQEIRHLPVLHAGKLVGVVTDRDVRLVESFPGVNPEQVRVDEAMTPTVLTATAEQSLAEAAGLMAEKRYGSAVVMDGTKVVGILTAVDMCRAVADLLDGRTRAGKH